MQTQFLIDCPRREAIATAVSSEWRSFVCCRSHLPQCSDLKISTYQAEFNSSSLLQSGVTALAAHSTLPVLAFGYNGLPRNSIHVVKCSNDYLKESKEVEHSLFLQARQPKGSTIDLSFSDDRILSATDAGIVYLYRLDLSNLQGSATVEEGRYVEKFNIVPDRPGDSAISTNPAKGAMGSFDSTFSVMGRLSPNQRVNRVKFRPSDTGSTENVRFAAIANNRLSLWDIKAGGDVPVIDRKISSGHAFALEWNPHSSDILVVAGITGAIKLVDTRILQMGGFEKTNQMNFSSNNSHVGGIFDIAWNPFVPHWIATAGADSIVKIWDTRMMRSENTPCLLSFGMHTNEARHLSWSPTHCEMLASGGNDKTMRIINLRMTPHYQLASVQQPHPITGVVFSQATPFQVHCISKEGRLVTASLTRAFIRPLVPTRLEADREDDKLVEIMLYIRDFQSATTKVAHLGWKYLREGKIEDARRIVAMWTSVLPDAFFSLSQKYIPPQSLPPMEALGLFEKELREFLYFVPKLASHLGTVIQSSKRKQMANLIIGVDVRWYLEEGDFEKYSALESSFFMVLQKDVTVYEPELLQDITVLLLKLDFIEALKFGIRLAGLMNKQGRWSSFRLIADALLYPTIFEVPNTRDNGPKCNEYFVQILSNPDLVLAQLKEVLDISMICASMGFNVGGRADVKLPSSAIGARAADKIVNMMEFRMGLENVEVFYRPAVALYFNAVLTLKKYDWYVIQSTVFAYQIRYCACSDFIYKNVRESLFKMKEASKVAVQGRLGDPIKCIPLIHNHSAAVTRVLNESVVCIEYFSEDSMDVVVDMLDDLKKALESILFNFAVPKKLSADDVAIVVLSNETAMEELFPRVVFSFRELRKVLELVSEKPKSASAPQGGKASAKSNSLMSPNDKAEKQSQQHSDANLERTKS